MWHLLPQMSVYLFCWTRFPEFSINYTSGWPSTWLRVYNIFTTPQIQPLPRHLELCDSATSAVDNISWSFSVLQTYLILCQFYFRLTVHINLDHVWLRVYTIHTTQHFQSQPIYHEMFENLTFAATNDSLSLFVDQISWIQHQIYFRLTLRINLDYVWLRVCNICTTPQIQPQPRYLELFESTTSAAANVSWSFLVLHI